MSYIPLFKKGVIILDFCSGGRSAIVKEHKVVSQSDFSQLVENNFVKVQNDYYHNPSIGRFLLGSGPYNNYLLVLPTKTAWLTKKMSIEDFESFMNVDSLIFAKMLMWTRDTDGIFFPFKKDIHKKYGILIE